MNLINWCVAHWALIAGTIVAIINELCAWMPQLKGNSIIQVILGLVNVGPGAAQVAPAQVDTPKAS